jgi:hypothetical protein
MIGFNLIQRYDRSVKLSSLYREREKTIYIYFSPYRRGVKISI